MAEAASSSYGSSHLPVGDSFLQIYMWPPLQRNVDKIEGNLRQLETKLEHERAKYQTYNKDLEEAEAQCVELVNC